MDAVLGGHLPCARVTRCYARFAQPTDKPMGNGGRWVALVVCLLPDEMISADVYMLWEGVDGMFIQTTGVARKNNFSSTVVLRCTYPE